MPENKIKNDEDFPLIRRDLVNAVEQMERTMNAYREISIVKEKTYSDLISRMDRELILHNTILFGDGSLENTGIIGEVKECKVDRKNRTVAVGWVWVGALTGIFTVAADAVAHFFRK